MTSPAPTTQDQSGGIFSPAYLAATVGLLTSIFAAAFDQTAVTSIMPTIVQELHGEQYYQLTFSAPLATAILGMVGAGLITDRKSAPLAFLLGSVFLAAGLFLALFSQDIATFLVSRALQGLGNGALIVAVYAVIARIYPEQLRPAVFAGFAGAWVVPSLIGPGVAGLIAEYYSWQAVFIFIIALLLVASVFLVKPLLSLPPADTATGESAAAGQSRALVQIAAAFGLSISSLVFALNTALGSYGYVVMAAMVPLVVVSLKYLVPTGTFTAAPGAGSYVLTRMLCDAFFAVEMFLPLALASLYGLGPKLTGIGLMLSGCTWFLSSAYQSRRGVKDPVATVFRRGSVVMVAGVLLMMAVLVTGGHWAFLVAGWAVSAAGMGFLYPRLSSEALASVPAAQVGFVGSALQVAGGTAMTLAMALGGVPFMFESALPALPGQVPAATGYFLIYAGVAVLGAVVWMLWRPQSARAHQAQQA